MESRIIDTSAQLDRAVAAQLKDPRFFDMVQQIRPGDAEAGAAPRYFSASRPMDSSPVLDLRGAGGLVQVDRRTKIPGVAFEFCIPPNPILIGLRLRTEMGLFKLSHCMNLAGLRRETPVYASPTDTRSGMPVVGASGALALPTANRLQATQYRYKVLVERAKLLLDIAQQLEAAYLSFLEKLDQETYTILRARHDLGLAYANVTLQGLRVTEADHGKTLAEEQKDLVQFTVDHFNGLLEEPELWQESLAFWLLAGTAVVQSLGAIVGIVGGAIAVGAATGGSGAAMGSALGALGGAILSGGQGLATMSSALSLVASYERRKQEWTYQRDLAELHDLVIAKQQITLADDRYNIVKQEEIIANLSASNAEDVVNFLNNKFTSAELYSWMSGVIGDIYRYFLEQATSIAKLAQTQLAFERQESGLDFILSDYWTVTSGSASLDTGNGDGRDRRGMTGSARLLHDLYLLDQHAFTTDRRKLQMSKTLSLALLDPIAFQQFRETGVLPFRTTMELFDRDFPGHYLRLVRRVRTSVIALIPPTHGIKATLSSTGISRAVISTEAGGLFEERALPREPESVALTAPSNDSGVFELQEQPEILLPFEGLGVANSWEFRMPKAANAFDYNTIADILVTFEYTALDSPIYRQQVIQRLDRTVSLDRPFSFRHQFADQWYDLHNPDCLDAGEADDRDL